MSRRCFNTVRTEANRGSDFAGGQSALWDFSPREFTDPPGVRRGRSRLTARLLWAGAGSVDKSSADCNGPDPTYCVPGADGYLVFVSLRVCVASCCDLDEPTIPSRSPRGVVIRLMRNPGFYFFTFRTSLAVASAIRRSASSRSRKRSVTAFSAAAFTTSTYALWLP
jgi:hypothetical protein